MKTKICTKCNQEKDVNEFYYKKDRQQFYTCGKKCKRKVNKQWAKDNPEKVRKTALRSYYKHKKKRNQESKETRLRVKKQIFDHYGNRCVCCGETTPQFLTIDHINGDGHKHKREIGKSGGISFYKWIIKNNFPKDLQILCFNCNCGRYVNGGICPHKIKGK